MRSRRPDGEQLMRRKLMKVRRLLARICSLSRAEAVQAAICASSNTLSLNRSSDVRKDRMPRLWVKGARHDGHFQPSPSRTMGVLQAGQTSLTSIERAGD